MNRKYLHILFLTALILCGCNPEAKWEDAKVEIRMDVKTVSACFVECVFTPTADAYYLIAIEPARPNENPLDKQKQFMTLALDSANIAYIDWRNQLLKDGEFNVAPFASHALQYGAIDHIFTGLIPNQDYWLYAFIVNPETLKPIGKLNLMDIHTAEKSVMDVHFEYRVKDVWDYIYPINADGSLSTRFPYTATTRDSVELVKMGVESPVAYFVALLNAQRQNPDDRYVYYGVQVTENNGVNSHLTFEEGHTYYTAIGGLDGSLEQSALFKFKWQGMHTDLYFYDTDSTNIIRDNRSLLDNIVGQ